MLSRRISIPLCLAMATFLSLWPAAPVRAEGPKDALELIPDDAWGFVVVKSLSNLDAKAAQFKELLGLQFATPITPGVLAMLNLADKVEMDQPICIVLMDANKYGGMMNASQAAVLFVPAKDAKALVDGLAAKDAEEEGDAKDEDKPEAESKDAKKPADDQMKPKGRMKKEGGKDEGGAELEEGVTKINLMGQTAFAAVKGKYAVVGQNQECVAKAAKAKKTLAEGFAEARTAALEQSDFYLSLSIKTIVGQTKAMWEPFLQMAMAPTDPEGKNFKNFMKMLEEMAAADIVLKLDKNAFNLLFLVTPQKDSDFEKMMKDGKNADKSLLAMLPLEKYLVAAAAVGGYSENAEKFGSQNWLADMLKQKGAEGLNEEAVKTLDAEFLKLAKSSGPSAMCLSFQPEGADGLFGLTWVWQSKDPKETVESFRKIYKTAWTVTEGESKPKAAEKKEAADEEEEGKKEDKGKPDADLAKWKDNLAKVKENIVHAADAETLEGNKVDTITIKLAGLGELLDVEADEVGLLQKIVGKEVVLRFGAVGDKHFLLTVGGGKKRFEDAGKHLKSPGDGLDKEASIKELSAALPGARGFEMFIAADNILQAVKAVAKALGEEEEFPIDMPTINAPLAMSWAMVGSVGQVNIVAPTKLIKAAKEAIEKQVAAGSKDFDEDEEDEEEGKDAGMDDEDEGGAAGKHNDEDKAKAKDNDKDKAKDKAKDKDKAEDEEEDEEE